MDYEGDTFEDSEAAPTNNKSEENMHGLRKYIAQKKKDAGLTGQNLASAIDYESTTLVKKGMVEIEAVVEMALAMDEPASKRDNIKIQERLSKNQDRLKQNQEMLKGRM